MQYKNYFLHYYSNNWTTPFNIKITVSKEKYISRIMISTIQKSKYSFATGNLYFIVAFKAANQCSQQPNGDVMHCFKTIIISHV